MKTNKELNKKLCELLGIEPKVSYEMKPTGEYSSCGGIIEDRFEIKTYPNFTKPENFVKLLDMFVIEHKFGIGCGINEIIIEGVDFYLPDVDSITELLIIGLTSFLESEYQDCADDCRTLEKCKRTYQNPAQQIQWEY